MTQRQFVSLGMFIVDQFLFEDEDGNPTGKYLDPQVSLRKRATHVCLLFNFSKNLNVNVDRRRGDLCCYRSEDLVSVGTAEPQNRDLIV